MRQLIELFCINGNPLPAPDAQPKLTLVERNTGASALDLEGFYHKGAERRLERWTLHYGRLTAEEYAYLQETLPPGDFFFTRPGVTGTVTTLAYARSLGGRLEDSITGAYRDVSVEIEEC